MNNDIGWVLDSLKEQEDRKRQAEAEGSEVDNQNGDSNMEREQ